MIDLLVGVVGFEPTTPCSQSRYANRTALHPELVFLPFGRGANVGSFRLRIHWSMNPFTTTRFDRASTIFPLRVLRLYFTADTRP